MSMHDSFYCYANPHQPQSMETALRLAQMLCNRSAAMYGEGWLAANCPAILPMPPEEMPGSLRAVIAVGGDGTLLRIAPLAAQKDIPLLGIHTGHVGFLMRGDAGHLDALADALLAPAYAEDCCALLQCDVLGQTHFALNDIAVTRGEHPGVMTMDVFADGERLFSPHGDGVVISTPLGATAYALAAGGPVVRPDTPCLLVTPLCVRELLLRPVVLPSSAQLTLRVPATPRHALHLAVDGQTLLPLTEDTTLTLHISSLCARLIRLEQPRFFDTLRKKQAQWNET